MAPPFDVANFSDTKRLITLLAAFSRGCHLNLLALFTRHGFNYEPGLCSTSGECHSVSAYWQLNLIIN